MIRISKELKSVITVLVLMSITYLAILSNIDADINIVSKGRINVSYTKPVLKEMFINGQTTMITSHKEVDEKLSLDCSNLSLKDCDDFYNKMDTGWGKEKLEGHIKKVLGLSQSDIIHIY